MLAKLKNPKALLDPDIYGLFDRAFMSNPGGARHFRELFYDVAEAVVNPRREVIIGIEDGQPKGLLLLALPDDNFTPIPSIRYFYSEGSVELRHELQNAIVDYVKSHGYSAAWAVNMTGRDDKVWLRLFNVPGWTPREQGTVFEFTEE